MIYYIALVKKISEKSRSYDDVPNLFDTIYMYDTYEAAYEKYKQYKSNFERTLSSQYCGITMFSSASKLYQITFIRSTLLDDTGLNKWYEFDYEGDIYSPHWDLQPYEVAKTAVDYYNSFIYKDNNISPAARVKAVMFPSP